MYDLLEDAPPRNFIEAAERCATVYMEQQLRNSVLPDSTCTCTRRAMPVPRPAPWACRRDEPLHCGCQPLPPVLCAGVMTTTSSRLLSAPWISTSTGRCALTAPSSVQPSSTVCVLPQQWQGEHGSGSCVSPRAACVHRTGRGAQRCTGLLSRTTSTQCGRCWTSTSTTKHRIAWAGAQGQHSCMPGSDASCATTAHHGRCCWQRPQHSAAVSLVGLV